MTLQFQPPGGDWQAVVDGIYRRATGLSNRELSTMNETLSTVVVEVSGGMSATIISICAGLLGFVPDDSLGGSNEAICR